MVHLEVCTIMTAFLKSFMKIGAPVEKVRKSSVNAVVLTDLPNHETVVGIAKKVIPQ